MTPQYLLEIAGLSVTKEAVQRLSEAPLAKPANNFPFFTVGYSTEDDGVWFDKSPSLQRFRWKTWVTDDLAYSDIRLNTPAAVRELTEHFRNPAKFDAQFPTEETHPGINVVCDQFEAAVAGKQGYLIHWAIEYDDNVAFVSIDDPYLLKKAVSQQVQLPT